MKIELSKAEIWALLGTLDGVWSEERSAEQTSAYDKLSRAHAREHRAMIAAAEAPKSGEGDRG